MPLSDFDAIKVKFSCKDDSESGKGFDYEFTRTAFQEVRDMPLFQMAANEQLKKLHGDEECQLAIKYQVLSNGTAMVGVVKQKKKETGELLNFNINHIAEKKP